MADDSKVLLATALAASRESTRGRALAPDTEQAWRWIGWFALVLAIAGLGDWTLAWFPLHFGNTEWEFATIVSTFAALPLVTMGLAGMAGSAVARGVRWQMRAIGVIVLLWGLVIVAALLVFLLDVPVALRMVQGPAHLGVQKAIAKTVLLGVLFSAVYLGIGISALRRARATKA